MKNESILTLAIVTTGCFAMVASAQAAERAEDMVLMVAATLFVMIVVCSQPAPSSVTGLSITIRSSYTPGAIRMIAPGAAASIASWTEL